MPRILTIKGPRLAAVLPTIKTRLLTARTLLATKPLVYRLEGGTRIYAATIVLVTKTPTTTKILAVAAAKTPAATKMLATT